MSVPDCTVRQSQRVARRDDQCPGRVRKFGFTPTVIPRSGCTLSQQPPEVRRSPTKGHSLDDKREIEARVVGLLTNVSQRCSDTL